ncbi:hypothetical protein F2Q69_00051388 [Brassica cretica]|uniref:CMP/dCMP-type deaminase domain-containing protein n=1 Tax=Brassica cretica TaxID=69181 RepID=A0A8S9PYA2_BRACR|nr:hypothetical protein F2Q69_00051388 [Brassica cretica]
MIGLQNAAVSKEEWEEQSILYRWHWGFSEDDTQSICKFMRVAIDLAISAHKPLVNAAVLVDPSVRQIIASETDQVYPSSAPRDMASAKAVPLKERVESNHCHSIDRVTNASSEICLNGILDKLNSSLSTVACLNPWQWSVQSHDSESQWHPLRHASVVAIESSAARYRYLFPNPTDNSQPSNADCPAKRQKTNSHNPEVQNNKKEEALRDPSIEKPYLCTGYDIFLLWEPCTICELCSYKVCYGACASKNKTSILCFSKPHNRGLGSVHRLQGEKSLNLHYAVFRVLLPGVAHNALHQGLKHVTAE